jgi:hypothetical protein
MAVTFDELRQRLKEERDRLIKQQEQNRAAAPVVGEMKEGSPYGKKEEGASEAFELEKRLALEKRLIARLEVLPQANLCLNCKALQSKNAKGKLPAR